MKIMFLVNLKYLMMLCLRDLLKMILFHHLHISKQLSRQYKDKMNSVIKENNSNDKEEKIEIFKSRILEIEKAHPRKSSNLYFFGQEVQMDVCIKIWFGGISSYLHHAVDKAKKKFYLDGLNMKKLLEDILWFYFI